MYWAPGYAGYDFANSTYNYWTANGASEEDPGTASFPIADGFAVHKFSQILPGNGFRDLSGVIFQVGTDGHYWSGTPYDFTNSYRLAFNFLGIYPLTYSATYERGQSIRCVRP